MFLGMDHPILFAVAMLVALAIVFIARRRHPAIHPLSAILALLAIVLFGLAAGGLTWRRPATTEVVVMVDLSPSTRGAAYRDPSALQRRIGQLLADAPYRVLYFAQQNTPQAPAGSPLPDLPAQRTTFMPPPATAILLFSDARFDLPTVAPPTFIVADPQLDDPADGAVARLWSSGAARQVAASLRVAGPSRRLSISGATTRPTVTIDPGDIVITRPVRSDAKLSVVSLSGSDAWPENDSLTLPMTPPLRSQRWLVSSARTGIPADGWTVLSPRDLPTDSQSYLAPAVIVLDDVAAADLSVAQQQRLVQYVRDLGGGLVITGGPHAFAAGLYPGTVLETLSPLASSPPRPTLHWMLLADCSGSMQQPAGNPATTRWSLAAGAILELVPRLPPEDPVTIGCFARDLTWWHRGRPAREILVANLPPDKTTPNGPTNLSAALDRIANEADGALETHLLVATDTDTTIEQPEALARRLLARKIHLHVLGLSEGRGLEALSRMTAITGGSLRRQFDDPARWAAEARQLLSAALPRMIQGPLDVAFRGDLSSLPGRSVSPVNRTWLKQEATLLARASADAQEIPMAARWTIQGDVIAAAFAPTADELQAMADPIARPPRDPRFTVAWDIASKVRVRIDAADPASPQKPLNGIALRLQIADAADPQVLAGQSIPQTAPGRYELSVDAPRQPAFGAILYGAQTLDRNPLPGRYPPEFDRVGNDYDAMRALAAQSGGKVVYRTMTTPLPIPFPRQSLSLSPFLALLAAFFLAGALVRWRWG